MSSISVGACISGSISPLYLEPSSGSFEASSPVNSCSQKNFQTILSDSQVHPHSGPLVYTWCHSSILSSTHSTRYPGIYQPLITPTTLPETSSDHTSISTTMLYGMNPDTCLLSFPDRRLFICIPVS